MNTRTETGRVSPLHTPHAQRVEKAAFVKTAGKDADGAFRRHGRIDRKDKPEGKR
jgi:hypothetical protein